MGCFQKETGDFIDLPFRRPSANLFQEAAEGAPSTSRLRGSRLGDEKLFCVHVLIVKWIFQMIYITCNPRVYETVLFKMYGTSHVASTPGASSTAFNGEHRCSFSQRIFPSDACAFLDDDPAYECCSANPLTGSLSPCRRSRRLLSNGYYILTEDSFLSDEEGNITLTPSQTSVTYKENLVRVFRRRKKIRRSLASLFNLGASTSWLSSTVLNNMDSSHVDDPWPDGCDKLEANQSDIGDSDFSSEYNSHVPQRQTPSSNGASLTKDDEFLQPEKRFCASKSCSPLTINANKETLSNAESRTVRNVLSQMVALMTCLTISICTRYFLGGLSATLLLIILVFLLSQDAAVSSFFSLYTSFKTTKFW
ncbi:transmembrane protein 71 isoform X3 [Aquila chrysaetos chrysaetos]|uniref:transmembrane protein 71 isoform X3 n=1 Tax=Aquila chrysaetos chrysaetos TaxID=223781 RepID=UPI001B7D3A91|nr:transmembrane protein 71 isoform X3 [Aquila chrysaetos chrysaetos]